MFTDITLMDPIIDWMAHGVWNLAWWQIVLVTLALTHITIAAVTIYLHRNQAHRAVDLHPIVSHFFRFWLWMTTGMVTKEWTAIHRKHHAKCETHDDPHSPQTRGIDTVFWKGSELYRDEAKNAETLSKYGHGTPDDWIERNLYTAHSVLGVALMMVVNIALFGVIGVAIWAVQMIWIPVMAAGVINGIGHYWGYRNFEAPDASTNISPWGIIIGGEELHNNHHTYPTSAKFSVRPYEFDLGWQYIRLMRVFGLATVKKVPPKLQLGDVRPVADERTLEALIANRYEVMASYAREMRKACVAEIQAIKSRRGDFAPLQAAKRLLHRDSDRLNDTARAKLEAARRVSPALDKMAAMREELRQMWSNTTRTREQLAADLQAWCRRAEESGVAALRDFSFQLRSAYA